MVAVCVDASLVLAWLLPEQLSGAAFSLKQLWDEEGAELIAPSLVQMEVPSSLRQAVYRGRITLDEGDEALKAFLEMDIRIRHPEGLLGRTWELGKAVNAPRLYALYYLALAEMEGCELWTADRRLVNLAGPRSAVARWIGDVPSEASGG